MSSFVANKFRAKSPQFPAQKYNEKKRVRRERRRKKKNDEKKDKKRRKKGKEKKHEGITKDRDEIGRHNTAAASFSLPIQWLL